MSDLEFVGKMNPQPFISMRKEEEMGIEKIKEIRKKGQLKTLFRSNTDPEPELTYVRDVQEDY